ncbi:MAG: cell division protein FtsL [Pseudomonadota bacterium]
MIRVLNICLVIAVLAVALQVYGLEHESRDAGKRLTKLHEEIAEERETIRRLRAEWSYLNTPARLEKLAARYLAHEPEDVARVVPDGQIGEQVPQLQKAEPEEQAADPISEMLSGTETAVSGAPVEGAAAADPIGDILKGMDQ